MHANKQAKGRNIQRNDIMIKLWADKLKLSVKAKLDSPGDPFVRIDEKEKTKKRTPPSKKESMTPVSIMTPHQKKGMVGRGKPFRSGWKGAKQEAMERLLMGNPFARGKGIKATKITKALIGTNSFFENIIKIQKARETRALLKSPERDLRGTYIEKTKRPGLQRCNLPQGMEGITGVAQKPKITEVLNMLLPCLYIGCALWWCNIPEVGQVISQGGTGDLGTAATGILEVENAQQPLGGGEGQLMRMPEEKSPRAVAIWIAAVVIMVTLTVVANKAKGTTKKIERERGKKTATEEEIDVDRRREYAAIESAALAAAGRRALSFD